MSKDKDIKRLENKLTHIRFQLRCIENPALWQHKLDVQNAYRKSMSKVVYPKKDYIKESEVNYR